MKRYISGLAAWALFLAAVFAAGCKDMQPRGAGETSAVLSAPGGETADPTKAAKEPEALQPSEEEEEALGAFSLRF